MAATHILTIVSAFVVAASIAWAATHVAAELRSTREQAARARTLDVAALFAPGIAAAAEDPRALLTWQPLAAAARKLYPDAFQALDDASGARFPFSLDQIQAAHSQWTADWLAWELAHDGEFKLKAAAAEAEAHGAGGQGLARARVDAVEREKLESYQRRYADYIRVAKALQALLPR
jgi:hypothetical protein